MKNYQEFKPFLKVILIIFVILLLGFSFFIFLDPIIAIIAMFLGLLIGSFYMKNGDKTNTNPLIIFTIILLLILSIVFPLSSIFFSIIHFIWGSLNIVILKKNYNSFRTLILSFTLSLIFLVLYFNFEAYHEYIRMMTYLIIYYLSMFGIYLPILFFLYGLRLFILKKEHAFSIILFSISAIILSYFSIGTLRSVDNELEEKYCESSGNLYTGMYPECFKVYKDGGKKCNDNNQCEGLCVIAKEDLPNLPENYYFSEGFMSNKYTIQAIEYFKKTDNLQGKCEYNENTMSAQDALPSCRYLLLENGRISNDFIENLEKEWLFSGAICDEYNKQSYY